MDRILFVAPTPPVHTGPEVATKLLLESSLARRFELIHIRSNIRKVNRSRGTIDIEAMTRLVSLCAAIVSKRVMLRPRVLYCAIGSNRSGFLRDFCVVTLAKLLGLSVVAHYRGGNFANFFKHASPWMKPIIRAGLGRMDLVIVQAERLRREFDGLYPPGRLRVLYNGIDCRDIQAVPRERRPNTGVNILFLGSISFAKGFYDLLLAFKAVLVKHPDCRLTFAGELIRAQDERNIVPAYFSPEVRQRFAESTAAIEQFLDEQEQYNATYLRTVNGDAKKAALAAADIFVLPSYSEGFSNAVLEAIASGLPVVATTVGAMPEFIEDGINGFLITPGDHATLADRLTRLVSDQPLRTEMGARNAEKARREFDIEDVASALGDIFMELITSRPATSKTATV